MRLKLERALQRETLCYITTYNPQGKPGTVEIWFLYHGGVVYISTGAQSLKVRKLRADPRARVAFGSRHGPTLEGTVQFADEATVARVVLLLSAKYGDYWGPLSRFVGSHAPGRSRVLLALTPGG